MAFIWGCSAGKYLTGNGSLAAADCLLCKAGTYESGTGSTLCSNCSTGTYLTGSGFRFLYDCSNCSIGHYQSGLAMQKISDCLNCSAGTYQSATGMSTWTASWGSLCASCPAGYYCPDGSSDPLPCTGVISSSCCDTNTRLLTEKYRKAPAPDCYVVRGASSGGGSNLLLQWAQASEHKTRPKPT